MLKNGTLLDQPSSKLIHLKKQIMKEVVKLSLNLFQKFETPLDDAAE
mgnify:CR=1 FL=1